MKYPIYVAPSGMIHIPSSMTTGSGIEVILSLYYYYYINFITSTILEFMESVLLIWGGGIYEVYCWDDLRWNDFMKLGANVQKLLEWGIHRKQN
jgi:hypothetical protein